MRRPVLALLVLVLLALPAAAAAKRPEIQAHRGGSVAFGKPVYPENTLPAFIQRAKQGFTLELDVKLTKDNIPVVIHDPTLERTTRCKGNVVDRTLKDLQTRCKVDVLGAPTSTKRTRRVPPRIPIPTLFAVLREMNKRDAKVSVEIKNYASDPQDYDNDSGRVANRIMDTVVRSHIPKRRLIIQSFTPANLMVARKRLPGVPTSQLLLKIFSAEAAIATAKQTNATYISPQYPIDRSYVVKAHAAGFKVAPYTIDRARDIRAAARLGIDALITDDPLLARRTLR